VAHPLEQLVDRHLRLVQLVELLADARRREQEQPDLARGVERKRLFGVDVQRIGGADFEKGVGEPERQHVMAPRELLGHAVTPGAIHLRDVGDLQTKAMRQLLENLRVGRDLLGHDVFPQRTAGVRLVPKSLKDFGGQALDRLGQPFVWECGYRHAGDSKLLGPAPESSIPYHRMSQKSRVTSNATCRFWLCRPYPASMRNSPSHSAPNPSVTRVWGVCCQGVRAIVLSVHPAAT